MNRLLPTLLLLAPAAIGQITPGNLLVARAGSGAATFVHSQPVFLQQFDRNAPGAPLATIALPTAAAGSNKPFTVEAQSPFDTFLTQSVDGEYFQLTGYAVTPFTLAPGVFAPSVANRCIARIAMDGTVDTSTALTNLFGCRCAVSVDGSSFWVAGKADGGPSGMAFVGSVGATTAVQLPTTGVYGLGAAIVDGQLYATASDNGAVGLYSVGTGLPTVAGQSLSMLNGFSAPSGANNPGQLDFWFADAQTVYIADNRFAADGGGIQKWTENAGTWTRQYTIAPGTEGCLALSGVRDLAGTHLYATTMAFSANRLVAVTDTGPAAVFTTLATAPANTAFRGVRFVRQPYSVATSGTACPTSAGVPTVGTTGGAPVSGNANFALTIGNAPPFAPYVTIVSINQFVMPGVPVGFLGFPPCALLYTPTIDITFSSFADGAGNGVTPLSLGPADASLWGLDVPIQHLIFDPVLYGGFGLPLATTEALQIEIGN